MVTFLLPITVVVVISAEDIVSIAFGRGAFNAEGVHASALALGGYGFMFIPSVLREVFSRFLYSYQNTRTPSINSAIGIAVNIALSVLLYRPFGVFGVTLAASIAELVCGSLNMIAAWKHNSYLRYGTMLKKLPFLLAGGVAAVYIAKWAVGYWSESDAFVRFAKTTLLTFAGYFVIELPLLLQLLKERKQLNEA
jgi:putative peptidoglycan lipid II flippase